MFFQTRIVLLVLGAVFAACIQGQVDKQADGAAVAEEARETVGGHITPFGLVSSGSGTCNNDGTRLATEVCDDGAGPSCSETFVGGNNYNCSIAPHYSCPALFSSGACHGTCGDGFVVPGEACDDASTGGGDGCVMNGFSKNCAIETGWQCSQVGTGASTCTPICGDQLVRGAEACDDGVDNSDSIPDHCRTNCQLPSCGDGVEDATELCDDGLLNGRPGMCNNSCTQVAEWSFTDEFHQTITQSPDGIGIFLSHTTLDSVCSLTEVNVSDYLAKDAWLQGKDFIGGRVAVLTGDYIVDTSSSGTTASTPSTGAASTRSKPTPSTWRWVAISCQPELPSCCRSLAAPPPGNAVAGPPGVRVVVAPPT